ncbi:MAG: C-terminal helicase domain-containing protein, partial [Ignavibacteriaceae bacterium]|nr:C-terminal helicase domain-containing protein [Ignavibacteriaceae bacterium]
KHGADSVVKFLSKAKVHAEAIHGNKSQNARQRALNNFKSKQTRVLVATDIAARGIDIDDLSHVINFELPNVPETYIHRIGRTGRAGLGGVALSLCDSEEKAYLKDINKLISIPIPIVEEHPFVLIGQEVIKPKQSFNKSSVGKPKFKKSGSPAGSKPGRWKRSTPKAWSNKGGN